MGKKVKTAITPTREENYSEWYQQVIRAADLAEISPVRGCMVIKPWGYGLWEKIQQELDLKFKATGHKNAYFPLFIPLGFMEREAEHVEGFAKECAVITHHRLEADDSGRLVPAAELEEPLVVRPTSETIIGEMFAKWVQSYRDLPLLINQWANVVRWEMRTRLFLRTTEFLWQEGHTAHATMEEAQEEALRILDIYENFVQNYLAIPVIKGKKTDRERFPGAVTTYSIEAMMQDRKGLQTGTSHFLGQNFSRASNIKFLDTEGKELYAWTTSWGVSTRLIGALIMAHGDDDGLVLPPRLAPAHLVLLPVVHDDSTRQSILTYGERLARELGEIYYHDRPVATEIDLREERGGKKFWNWVKKGVPIRIEIGRKEVESDMVTFSRRDREHRERFSLSRPEFLASLSGILDEIQQAMFEKARKYRDDHIVRIDSKDEFYDYFTPANQEKPEIHGGFAFCHWNGKAAVEELVKNDLGVTIRCIPFDSGEEKGTCVISGEPSERRVLFAKAY